jgi:uncharacterized protein YqeY
MKLHERISQDLPVSIKSREPERTAAIRVLLGEFQRQPEKELSDEQVHAIIRKLIKAERELLAAAGKEESPFIEVIGGYLPSQAGDDEISAWIAANIDFSQFSQPMQAMRPIMAHFGSRADGNQVKKILQSLNS